MPYYNTPVSNEIHTLDKDTHLYQPLEMQFYSGRRVSVRPRNKKTFSRRSFLNLSFAALVAAACGPSRIEPSSLSPRTLAYIDYVTKYEHVGPGDKASPFINFGVDKFERLDHSLHTPVLTVSKTTEPETVNIDKFMTFSQQFAELKRLIGAMEVVHYNLPLAYGGFLKLYINL